MLTVGDKFPNFNLTAAVSLDKGKEFADIYTIYASDVEEARLRSEAESFGEICKTSWAKVKL